MDESTWVRFWGNVRVGGPGCWEWQAGRNGDGYGQARVSGKQLRAHRVAFAMLREDPGALCVLHRCDNPACVRPSHLFLGTRGDNNADRCAKGRGADQRGEGNPSSKLTSAAVVEIRARYAAGGVTQDSLAAEFASSRAAVWDIINRRSWSHVS